VGFGDLVCLSRCPPKNPEVKINITNHLIRSRNLENSGQDIYLKNLRNKSLGLSTKDRILMDK
jgi:hypothetical protein